MAKDGRLQIQMITKGFDGGGDGFFPGPRCERRSVGRTLHFRIILNQVKSSAQLSTQCIYLKYGVFGDGGDE
jgi:hypothetical protein